MLVGATHEAYIFSLGYLIYLCITRERHPFGLCEEGIINIVNNNWNKRLLNRFHEAFHLVSSLLENKKENMSSNKHDTRCKAS